MRLGLGLGVNRLASGGGSGPVSLLVTGDFTETTPTHSDLLADDIFRACRNGGGNGIITAPLSPSGNYRITGTLSAYDGAESGITGTRFRIQDNTTTVSTITTLGAIDVTVAITSGTIRFIAPTSGEGYRIDDFFVEAA